MSDERISQKRLEELEPQLCERDRQILLSLHKCRYLTTGQIQRLHFTSSATPLAAIKAANRNLKKLKDYGLVGVLTRRIGGARAGSSAYVWALRPAGFRLLCMNDTNDKPCKRFWEPSPYFLKHTLAVSECYLQFIEICNRHHLELKTVQIEPECWRYYSTSKGKPAVLKPDLFAVTSDGKYMDSWFIEIDLATESYPAVLEKCNRYLYYYQTGTEQQKTGGFPCVLWIVPDERRKSNITKHIAEEYAKAPKIFVIITPEELEPLILHGAADYLKQSQAKGGAL
jgi:hypothetical protein